MSRPKIDRRDASYMAGMGTDDVCPRSPRTKREHVPKLSTLTYVGPSSDGGSIFDVNCAHCGRSGSVVLELENVQW